MLLFFLLVIPLLSIGVNIHYFSRYPEDCIDGFIKSGKWLFLAFIVIIVLALIAGSN